MYKLTTPPKDLYFISVYYDGTVKSPNLFVCPKLEEAFCFAHATLKDFNQPYSKLRARKLEYVETRKITDDLFHTGEPEKYTPANNQKMVNLAEADLENAFLGILSKVFKGKRYYFMDHYLAAKNCDHFMELLKNSNKCLFVPAKVVYIYKPTTEISWSHYN